MKTPIIAIAVAGAAATAAFAVPAQADRAPTPEERSAVERVLRDSGYASWEEIELDDDGPRWEVDDARTTDGRRYDVKIDPRTLRIVRAQIDRD